MYVNNNYSNTNSPHELSQHKSADWTTKSSARDWLIANSIVSGACALQAFRENGVGVVCGK